jgi:hypothetical protein
MVFLPAFGDFFGFGDKKNRIEKPGFFLQFIQSLE